jgi:hypothetical protein
MGAPARSSCHGAPGMSGPHVAFPLTLSHMRHILGGMESKGGAATIKRTVSLVEREAGRIVSYAAPVACDCCGKLCTVEVFEMTDGARLGKECATVVDLATRHSALHPERLREVAVMMRATRKHLAYLGVK